MTKINSFFHFLLPCFFSSASAATTTTPSSPTACRRSVSIAPAATEHQRISTTRRDSKSKINQETGLIRDSELETDSISSPTAGSVAPQRPSKTMAIGTIFGPRRGHVWFCVQHDRLSAKPTLLLELSVPTHHCVREMQSTELVRIALECSSSAYTCRLRSVPMWALSCNGKKLGFAVRRRSNDQTRSVLKAIQSMTVGAGVIPQGLVTFPGQPSEEIVYMRANYEHMVGSADSESFHLINPDQFSGQELSVFLIRSK